MSTAPKQRWHQFSLRRLLAVIAVLGPSLAALRWFFGMLDPDAIGNEALLLPCFIGGVTGVFGSIGALFRHGLAGSLLGFFLAASLIPTGCMPPREVGNKATCTNNAASVAAALSRYELQHGALPPAYEADEFGRPMHSWRVLILPFLDDPQAVALYSEYDMREPWDGPHNRQLATRMPLIYRCRSNKKSKDTPSYLAVVGAETAWPIEQTIGLRTISSRDGVASTILLVEVADAGFNWLEPRDLSFDEAVRGINVKDGRPCISSKHPGGATVILCDGRFQFLSEDIKPATLRALLTTSGGELVNPADYLWPNPQSGTGELEENSQRAPDVYPPPNPLASPSAP